MFSLTSEYTLYWEAQLDFGVHPTGRFSLISEYTLLGGSEAENSSCSLVSALTHIGDSINPPEESLEIIGWDR